MNDTLVTGRRPVSTVDLQAFRWSQPLVHRYAHDFPSVRSLFVGNSADANDWHRAVERVTTSRAHAPQIGPVVWRQLEARSAPAQAVRAASRLADPKAVAIVTGQQAGLFGGPMYTLLKAVSAITLARWVETEFKVPAIPVFWVEAEDHDWEEVRHATFLDGDLTLTSATALDPPGARVLPVGRLRLADGDPSLEALRQGLPRTEFTADLLERLGRRYRAGERVGAAFAGWLDDILGAHGLVVYEADDVAAKPFVADIFARELTHPGQSAALVRQRATDLRAHGFEPQLEPADGSVALFYLDGEGRKPIRRIGDRFTLGSRQVSGSEAVAEASQHPERFSPNVVLRPIVQDRLFPTICYVGGPSEFVYHAQLRHVYAAFGIEPPLVHPRLTATVADAGTARFLERHQLSLSDLHDQPDDLLKRLVEQELPAGLDERFSDVQVAVASQVERLRGSVNQVDRTLDGALETTLTRIRESIAGLHGKVIQAAKRKDDTLHRQAQHAQSLVCPGGVPQERALSAIFFLNRYGPALVDRLLELDPRDPSCHYILYP